MIIGMQVYVLHSLEVGYFKRKLSSLLLHVNVARTAQHIGV